MDNRIWKTDLFLFADRMVQKDQHSELWGIMGMWPLIWRNKSDQWTGQSPYAGIRSGIKISTRMTVLQPTRFSLKRAGNNSSEQQISLVPATVTYFKIDRFLSMVKSTIHGSDHRLLIRWTQKILAFKKIIIYFSFVFQTHLNWYHFREQITFRLGLWGEVSWRMHGYWVTR